jgi:hypothetical protein
MKAAVLTLALAGGFFLSGVAASWAEEAHRRPPTCPNAKNCPGGSAANPQAAAKQPIHKPQRKSPQTQPTKPPQPTNPNGYP